MLEVVVAISVCSAGDQVLTGLPASFDEGLHLLFAETTHTLPLGSLPLRIHCLLVFNLLCWLMCLQIYHGFQNCCYRTRKHFLFVSSLTWLLTHLYSLFQKVVVIHPSYPEVKWSESCSVVTYSLQFHGLHSPWNSPGQNYGVGNLSLPQRIFPTQGSNPGHPHCGQILYQLSHKGSPRLLEWVAYPFSSGSSWPKNWTGISCIAGGFFTNWATREAPSYPRGAVRKYNDVQDGYSDPKGSIWASSVLSMAKADTDTVLWISGASGSLYFCGILESLFCCVLITFSLWENYRFTCSYKKKYREVSLCFTQFPPIVTSIAKL